MTRSLTDILPPDGSTLGNLSGEIGKEEYEVIRDKAVDLGLLIVKVGGRGVAAADDRASCD